MILTIFYTNGCKQHVRLHNSFLTEQRGRNAVKKLTISEVLHKAYDTALAIAHDRYEKHTIQGIEDTMQEMRGDY